MVRVNLKNIAFIISYIKKYWYLYLFGIFFLYVVDLFQILIPQTIGDAVDSLKSGSMEVDGLIRTSLYLLVIAAVIFVGRFMWRFFIMGAANRIERNLKNELFTHFTKLPLAFYEENKTGDLMAHFTNDIKEIRMSIGPAVMMSLDAVILFVLVVHKMVVSINPGLTLYAFIPLPLISIGGLFLGKILAKRFEGKQKAFAKLTDYVQESFSGIRVAKAFVQEPDEIEAFEDVNTDNYQKNRSVILLESIAFPLIMFITGLSYFITLAAGGYMTMINIITLGDFIAFQTYIGMLIWPLLAVGWSINLFSYGYASLKRVRAKFEEEEIKEQAGSDNYSFDNIAMKQLNFKYTSLYKKDDKDYFSLNDISFTIDKGQTIGVFGKTGAGKTTLVELLLRIKEPDKGGIYIDNVDIRDIPLRILRTHIGYVTQEHFLFSDTIKNNITLFNSHISEEMIHYSSELSDLHSNIIEFPLQYDTIVGEKGVTLSGGQKQRLSIARTFLRNPDILILDDALSAVDTATEEKILNGIRKEREGKTTILIAHRVSTLQWADKIIVLDDGKVVEQGTHDELIKNDQFYASIYRHQLLEQEFEEESADEKE